MAPLRDRETKNEAFTNPVLESWRGLRNNALLSLLWLLHKYTLRTLPKAFAQHLQQ